MLEYNLDQTRVQSAFSRGLLVVAMVFGLVEGANARTPDPIQRWATDIPCGRQEPPRILDESKMFTDVTSSVGITHRHRCDIISRGRQEERQMISGGMAIGDYDNDGWPDIYAVGGSGETNVLYRNLGNGRFEKIGPDAGVALKGTEGSGAIFADIDGDDWLDLFVTGINDTRPTLFRNRGDGTFDDITARSGLDKVVNSFSASFGDIDRDGDLDLYIAHWFPAQSSGQLWRNQGDGSFTDITEAAGLANAGMYDFTASFTDINNDGWLDLLVASDYGTSKVFKNNKNGTFTNATTPDISDENGMGSSVGDYNNDGHIDWFVTSISTGGISGNRMYKNRGDGTFADTTQRAGVRIGHWAWGSCFADFNNDGYLDIFHVNGFGRPALNYEGESNREPSVLYMSNGKNWFGQVTFTERAKELGIDDTMHGRGVACFDYDRDGDIDIYIGNNNQTPKLYRNNSPKGKNFLTIKLKGISPNTDAVGARIYVKTGWTQQMREIHSGASYISQEPLETHFGLNKSDIADEVRIVWPSQRTTIMKKVAVNQFLVIEEPKN